MSFWIKNDVKVLNKFKYSLELDGVIFYVKTAQFPKLSQEKQEATSGMGGSTVYKPGPTKWQPITFTFADIMLDSTENLLRPMSTQMFWFGIASLLDTYQQKSGLLVSRDKGLYDSGFSSTFMTALFGDATGAGASGRDKIKSMKINRHYHIAKKLPDADPPHIIESWLLQDILISEIDFGQGDYSSDDINEVSVTFTYDIARPQHTLLNGQYVETLVSEDVDNLESNIRLIKSKQKALKQPKYSISEDDL